MKINEKKREVKSEFRNKRKPTYSWKVNFYIFTSIKKFCHKFIDFIL